MTARQFGLTSGKWLGRICFITVFWLSVFVFIATLVMTIRSWRISDGWTWTASSSTELSWSVWHGTIRQIRDDTPVGYRRGHVTTEPDIRRPVGLVRYGYQTRDPRETLYASPVTLHYLRPPSRVYWTALGVQVYRTVSEEPAKNGLRNSRTYVIAPFWPLMFPSGLVISYRAVRRLRLRRLILRGLCPRCRYDLRATPAQCPECGWRMG
jgi:hypothetical protein